MKLYEPGDMVMLTERGQLLFPKSYRTAVFRFREYGTGGAVIRAVLERPNDDTCFVEVGAHLIKRVTPLEALAHSGK